MKENNNQLEIEILKNEIVNLDWNNKNLFKHTIRHPIGDWQNKDNSKNVNQMYKMLWGNLLGTYEIPKNKEGINFDDIKERYRKVSLDILSKLYNAIIYFHDVINKDGKKYRSVGIFEDREYKSNEKVLTTFIRGDFSNKKDYYYITTCYFKNRDFKEKFYYAYMLLEEPGLFKINMTTDKFFEKSGICNDISLDKLNKLLDKSLLSDDKVGEIFNYYVINGKIDTSRYLNLQYLYNSNYYINDIREINDKIEINNYLIDKLNNKRMQAFDDYIDDYIDDDFKKIIELISKWIWFLVNNIKSKVKEKYDDDLLDELFSRMVSNEDFDNFLDMLYENNRDYIDNEFEIFFEDCYLTLKIFLLYWFNVDSVKESCTLNGLNIKDYCCDVLKVNSGIKKAFIDMMIRFIEKKNDMLYEEKNNISYDMCMDDENMFYLSLYKNLAKSYDNYNDALFEFGSKYDDKMLKILEDNIGNYD